MKTKRQVYEDCTLKMLSDPNGTRMDIVFAAMDKYAMQESISFLEWSNSEGWQTYDSWHTWINCDTRQVLTTEQLYLDYLKRKNP